MWGFVAPPPQPAAKSNVTRKHQADGTWFTCTVCNAAVCWLPGAWSAADELWFRLRHTHEPAPKKGNR